MDGSTAAALGASTKMANTAARVIRESLVQYSKLTKRMPSIIQNSATAKGVLSAPKIPDSRLINTMAKATIKTERVAIEPNQIVQTTQRRALNRKKQF